MSDKVTIDTPVANDSDTKKRLFINSLSLYICSFLAVKIVTLIYKLTVAFVFQIKPGLNGFRLFGQNPSDSPVWRKISVVTYFSSDIIVPMALMAVAVLLWLRFREKKTKWIAGLIWLGFSSIQCILGGIMAGIIAQTNQYYFFSWMNIARFKMMIIAILMVPAIMVAGMFYNILFLRTKPYKVFGDGTTANRKVLKYSVLLPVVAGSFILSATSSLAFGSYEAVELASAILLALPVLFYIKIAEPPRYSTGYSARVYVLPLLAGAAGVVAFFVANIFLR